MAGEFLRRAGWDVSDEPVQTVAELTALIQREPFAIIGLSLSGETLVETAAICVQSIRRRPAIRMKILLGKTWSSRTRAGATLGADAVVGNGLDGVTVDRLHKHRSMWQRSPDPIPSDQ